MNIFDHEIKYPEQNITMWNSMILTYHMYNVYPSTQIWDSVKSLQYYKLTQCSLYQSCLPFLNNVYLALVCIASWFPVPARGPRVPVTIGRANEGEDLLIWQQYVIRPPLDGGILVHFPLLGFVAAWHNQPQSCPSQILN